MDKTINLIEEKARSFINTIRPPIEVREQVDMGFTYENNTLELFEIRPKWDNKNEKIKSPFA